MIVLLAGPIAAGKSTVARGLAHALGWKQVVVREALRERLGLADLDRAQLQRRGAELDQRTAGRWLLEHLQQQETSGLVVDSLRTRRQTLPLLEELVDSRLVFLNAHEETRRMRYRSAAAEDGVKRDTPFDQAMAHATETEVLHLGPLAHLALETDDLTAPATVSAILDYLGE